MNEEGPAAAGPGFMLDTQIFDRVADGDIPVEVLRGRRLFVTHVQIGELQAIPDDARRTAILAVFHDLGADTVPTSSAIWGDSYWGQAEWSDGSAYESILTRLQELDAKAGKRPKGFNQSRDARIAETALKRGFTLVTDDKNLAAVMRESGGRAISSKELGAEPD